MSQPQETKKEFDRQCRRLDELGYSLVEYEPESKYAKYELNDSVQIVGAKK